MVDRSKRLMEVYLRVFHNFYLEKCEKYLETEILEDPISAEDFASAILEAFKLDLKKEENKKLCSFQEFVQWWDEHSVNWTP